MFLKNASYTLTSICDMNKIFGSERCLQGSIIWFEIKVQQRNCYEYSYLNIFAGIQMLSENPKLSPADD